MDKHKHIYVLIVLASVMLIALSIAYYFLFSLPKFNNDKLKLEEEKQAEDSRITREKVEADQQRELLDQQRQEEEKNAKMSELAKKIQDDCIKSTQDSIVAYFDKTITSASPLYYPYENESAFNKNERLLTSLSAYRDCLRNDPRNSEENSAIQSMLSDSWSAYRAINNYMVAYKEKAPGLCDMYLLTQSAKSQCKDISYIKYDFELNK